MTDYVDAFGNNSIPVADAEYGSYTLTASASFNWPYNYSGTGYIVYKTMEIACANGNVITMPPANQVSTGETTLVRNVGAESLTIVKSDATSLATIAAGAAVMLYVTDNSTEAGSWGIITYGTGSSSADAVSLAGYGIVAQDTILSAAYPIEVQAAGFVVDEYDRAKSFIYTGGTDTVTLPSTVTVGNDFFILLRNSGTGTLTIVPGSGEDIDDSAEISFNPGESAILVCSGEAWYTVGYGRSIIYTFTQLVKDVSAAGTFTLTDAEAGNKLLTFTGSPASAVTIEVPDVVSIYYVNSDITTAQTITIKTVSGSGSGISQGQRSIMFCDGVDVLDAQTATVSGAISLENGSSASPSLKFATSSNTGLYRVTNGFAATAEGVNVWTADDNGFSIAYGYLKLPGATTPSQIVEGAAVWDTDSDLLTIGTGSGRKTLCDTDSTQTLSGKTLTSPTINTPTITTPAISNPALNGTVTTTGLTLPAHTSGAINSTTIPTSKTLVTTDGTQTLTNKTIGMAGALDCNNNLIQEIKTATFNSEYNIGTTSGAVTCNFSNGQKLQVTTNGNITSFALSFPGIGHYQLRIILGGSHSVSWTFSGVTAYQIDNTTPVVASGKSTFMNIFYDGAFAYYSRSQQA